MFLGAKEYPLFQTDSISGEHFGLYFDRGRHSRELVIGIHKESDYVTMSIQKPSIGPCYLPNQAQTPQSAIQYPSQYGPNSSFKKKN